MKGKASDICTKCKHCEGLDRFGNMYSCKHYNNYPDSAIGMDCDIACYNFEEVNMNKVEGKVGEFCPKCKNCKGVFIREYDKHEVALIFEVECEDPYDGMTKILNVDDDICCERFEPKPPCEKCERFDGLYCHNSIGITTPSCTASFGEPGNCPSYEEKKEKEPFNLNMPREAIETIAKLNNVIFELQKEKAAHMKGIERLKKSQEKLQNQVKNLQTTNEESYKREEKLEDKVHKLEKRLTEEKKKFDGLDNEFLMPLARVLYPGEKVNKLYSDVLEDVKDLKIYSDENGRMYKELQEWREKWIALKAHDEARGNDIGRLISVNKKLDNKISELQNIVTEKEVEIKGLKKEIINLSFDRATVKDIMKKNIKFKETISDQEVTIKALLITIKEMCKEDETNA